MRQPVGTSRHPINHWCWTSIVADVRGAVVDITAALRSIGRKLPPVTSWQGIVGVRPLPRRGS